MASSVTFEGSTLKLAFDAIRENYEGKLSERNSSLKGTLTQGSALPLDLERATEESSWRRDRTPHKIQFVTVEDNVKLEVIDWGGSGRTLILLAGGNNNAHSFDRFAPKLTPHTSSMALLAAGRESPAPRLQPGQTTLLTAWATTSWW